MSDYPVSFRTACWMALVLLVLLLTGGAYYTSDVRGEFRNYGERFPPSQTVILDIPPATAKRGGGIYLFGYSVQKDTDALSVRLNVDDPAYDRAVITTACMYPSTNEETAIALTESPVVMVFQPFSYHIQRMGTNLEIKRFGATCRFPVNLDTSIGGYAIDIHGYYLLQDGRRLQFRILDFVKFVRHRRLVPMFRVLAEC